MLLQVVSYAHQSINLINKYIKNSNIVQYYYSITTQTLFYLNVLKCNLFLWCEAEYSASLLQSSVSHDTSEIILIYWFAAQ